jgi:hypothetical protein
MHRIEVPEAWFEEGAHLEIELPPRLVCARCEGGGCDACGRSGAITLHSQNEEPLVVRVGLPKAPPSGVVVLRIPEGGAPYRSPGAATADLAQKPEPQMPDAAEVVRSPAEGTPSAVAGLLGSGKAPSSEARAPLGGSVSAAVAASGGVAGLLAGKSDAAVEVSPMEGTSSDEGTLDGAAPAQSSTGVPPSGEVTAEGVPDEGAPNAERELGHRGTLYLRVTAATAPSPGVTRAYGVQSAAALSDEERRRLMRRSGLLVAGLVVLFLVLLWLSGWL